MPPFARSTSELERTYLAVFDRFAQMMAAGAYPFARDPDDLYRVAEEIRLCPGITRTSTSVYLREVIGYRVRPLLRHGGGPRARTRRAPVR